MVGFLVRFLGLLLVLSFVYNLPAVGAAVVEPWNDTLAKAAFWMMRWFDTDLLLSGNIISTAAGAHAVSVENDCNGVEPTMLLLCAILAYSAPWKARLVGLLYGLLFVQGLNLVRIVSLFYLGQWHAGIFDWTHKYLWPVILIVVVMLIFAWWTRSPTHAVKVSPRPSA